MAEALAETASFFQKPPLDVALGRHRAKAMVNLQNEQDVNDNHDIDGDPAIVESCGSKQDWDRVLSALTGVFAGARNLLRSCLRKQAADLRQLHDRGYVEDDPVGIEAGVPAALPLIAFAQAAGLSNRARDQAASGSGISLVVRRPLHA